MADDVFKAWAADKVDLGSPFVIGQHGGHYGIGLWSFVEKHEIAISDRYLTWGWSTTEHKKIVPVGQLKSKRPLKICHAKQSKAMLVTCTVPRQSYHLMSITVSGQWLRYLDDQFTFIDNLPQHIQDALTVRLNPHDLGWGQIARWNDRFPNITLDSAESKIDDLIRKSKIYISTYNATTFLESFTMNIPTIIYWDSAYWELRDTAIPYFDELKRVGIFHETPISAAQHVANIWDDVDAWWNSIEVRETLNRFKEVYCHLPVDLLDRLESTLKEVINDAEGSV